MHKFDAFVPHFFSRVRGTHNVVTPDIVSEVLHIPRVVHANYPGCKLLSLFYEKPVSWVDYQNTLYSSFAKDPRFLTW